MGSPLLSEEQQQKLIDVAIALTNTDCKKERTVVYNRLFELFRQYKLID